MPDKYQPLRDLLARVNGEDTDDCFNAYLEWRKTFDIEHCKALLAERDTLREVAEKVSEALASYERYGEVCPFEGNSMIYADTLVELGEQARAALSK